MGQSSFADVAERLFADFEGRLQLPEIVRAVTDAFRDLAGSVAEPSLPEMV